MKEKDLVKLGFSKTKVSKEESGHKPFHYYTWSPAKRAAFTLISCANDECSPRKGWWVEMFDDLGIRLHKKREVKSLISIVKKNLKK